MATIKGYTDLSQSQKLAKILSFESADKYWRNGVSDKYIQCSTPFIIDDRTNVNFDYDVPCWSLAALLSILPRVNIEKEICSDDAYDYRVKVYI